MNQQTELRQQLRQQARQRKQEKKLSDSSDWGWKLLQVGLTLLPLITVFLFLLGMTHHSGYLSGFQVDSSEFPLTPEQTLLTGVISLSLHLLPLAVFPIVGFGVMCIAWAVIMVAYQSWKNLLRKIQKKMQYVDGCLRRSRPVGWVKQHGAQPHEAKIWVDMMDGAFSLYIKGCVILIVCVLVFSMAKSSYEDGSSIARNQISEMREDSSSSANKISYAKHPNGVLALRIVCNTYQCAFWTKEDGTIYLRHEQIDSATIPSTSPIKPTAPVLIDGMCALWSTGFIATCPPTLPCSPPVFTPLLINHPHP